MHSRTFPLNRPHVPLPNTPFLSLTRLGLALGLLIVPGRAFAGLSPLVVTTSAQPTSAYVGSPIFDTATLTGGANPTGTVTYRLYDNPNGIGTSLLDPDTEPVFQDGSVAQSVTYTPTAPGTLYWVATYNGDANNASVSSGLADEPVTILPVPPVVITTTQLPATVIVGAPITDSATLSGGFNPRGTVTYRLYDNPNGTGTSLFEPDTEPVFQNGLVANSASFWTTATGTLYWVATYDGDANNAPVSSGLADEPVIITPATPTINVIPEPDTAPVGTAIGATAKVTGGFNPTGTITFNLYDNATGTGTPVYIDTEDLIAGVAHSRTYPTIQVGTYSWVAIYNGDPNNNQAASIPEYLDINRATSGIATIQQPASAMVGASIADTATVSGGFNPTGTVTFYLFDNPTGTGTPLFTDTEPLVGTQAHTVGYTTTATGTLYWVATYNGDANNSAVTSGPADEPVTITPPTARITTTQQPATATVGTSIADTATITGSSPTGTVTFKLYNNPNGAGTALFTDTESLVGTQAHSVGYTTTSTGTLYWVATYNGDANNSAATSGLADEPVTITPATPGITTIQQPATATVGTSIADTATVTGGSSPTGSVTFKLYNNPNGAGTALFTDTESLVGGTASSKSYVTSATGVDYWVVTYNGDANNSTVTSGAANEPVSITSATPTIRTTQLPAIAAVDNPLEDTATVTGGFNPTGTVTFYLYSNPNGTGTPLFTDTELLVNGSATTTGYTAIATGADYWVATYNGDANNISVSSGAADEPVTVFPAVTANCPIIMSSDGQSYPVQGVAIMPATLVGSGGCSGPYTFGAAGLPTGLSMSTGGIISGTPAVVGKGFNYTVTVTDNCGDPGSVQCSMNIGYNWSGFLSPFPKAVYKAGSTVPIKFMLTGASAGIKNLVATASVAPVDNNNVAGTYKPIGTFKYDPATHNYVLNWSTKPPTKGTFRIQADLGDGVQRSTADVILK